MTQKENEELTAPLDEKTKEIERLTALLEEKTKEIEKLNQSIAELTSPPCRYGRILGRNPDNTFDVSIDGSKWRVHADSSLIGQLETGQEVVLNHDKYSIVKIRESQTESDLEQAVAESTTLRDTYKRVEKGEFPEVVQNRVREELKHVARLSVAHPEASTIINYLDWLTSLPWTKESEAPFDIERVERHLNKTHYGLREVKKAILRFLAAQQLLRQRGRESASFMHICLIGPPGTGKTTIARSIADGLNRKFIRIALGGVHDESEIRGHRQTYFNSRPGRIMAEMRRAGVKNPVIFLDEIDKIGHTSAQGDPAAALLELLDPAQNHEFVDHYIEIGFDFSKAMFIAAANEASDILLPSLCNRMYEISCPEYSPEEKIEIAMNYILPAQRETFGLTRDELKIEEDGIREIVRKYLDRRNFGMRGVERVIAQICEEIAYRIIKRERFPCPITTADLPEMLRRSIVL